MPQFTAVTKLLMPTHYNGESCERVIRMEVARWLKKTTSPDAPLCVTVEIRSSNAE